MGVSTQINVRKALSSYENLKKCFGGEIALKQLRKSPQASSFKVLTRNSIPYHGNLSGRWYVCQIATLPCRELLALCFIITGHVMMFLFHRPSGNSWLLAAERLRVGFADDSTCKTKVYWLQYAANFPQKNKEAQAIYNHPPIPIDSIKDERVKSTIFSNKELKIKHSSGGVCRGSCLWFVSLYFRSRPLFKDPEKHLLALSALFKEGAPSEAVFLQALSSNKECLEVQLGKRERVRKKGALTFRQQARKHIHQMDKGVYMYGVPHHATVFIKINKKLGFFFDPTFGLFKVEGPDLANQVVNLANLYLSWVSQVYVSKKPFRPIQELDFQLVQPLFNPYQNVATFSSRK